MSEYYDRRGISISREEWMERFESNTEKRVAFDATTNGEVSTVWLGLDHGFGEGPPLIFETMVFGGQLDQECERYSTEEQAITGHASMLERVIKAARTTGKS